MPTLSVLSSPESWIHSQGFALLATLVAVNTLMYAALSVVKLLPPITPVRWLRRGRRAASRAVFPDES